VLTVGAGALSTVGNVEAGFSIVGIDGAGAVTDGSNAGAIGVDSAAVGNFIDLSISGLDCAIAGTWETSTALLKMIAA
jgi:hypothetical protein